MYTKIIKLNRLSSLSLLSATSSPSLFNGNIYSAKRFLTTICAKNSQLIGPYVEKPYSYAIGRSDNHLRYKTIGQLFDERIQIQNDRPIIISHHENIKKYITEFYEEVCNLSKALYENVGLKRGDVIGLWSCNTYNWMLIQYACARLGLIMCTINPFYRKLELDYALRKAGIKTLFMPGKNSRQDVVNKFTNILYETLQPENKDVDENFKIILDSVISVDGDAIQQNDIPNGLQIKSFELQKLKQVTGNLDSSITESVLPDDPAIIMFTSGTTGKPKGACLSHFSIVNNVRCSANKMQIGDKSTLCVPLPFFHVFAGLLGNLAIIFSETQLVIPCLKYNVSQLTEAINVNKVTHMYATPTLAIDLLNYVRNNNIDVPSLIGIMAGGASVPVEIAHQIIEHIPSCQSVRIGYGSTESGPAATMCSSLNTLQESTETVGSPLDFIEIKLIDPKTKQIVKLGETGELHTRGPHIMLGYWKDEEKTAQVIDKSGWYNTEDLAVMDEKGLVRIIGRTKEMIIVGGENVYPREVEEFLYTHPSVEIVHVIGIPDERRGEEVCAWVKLQPNAKLTQDELKAFCKDKITYFKIPKYILFVDEFPLTPTGKAQKFKMQEITMEKLNLKKQKS